MHRATVQRAAGATTRTEPPPLRAIRHADEHGTGALAIRTEHHTLPDPEPLLSNLARSVIEALSGIREVEQLARWVAPEVFSLLIKRVQHSARARRGRPVSRPMIEVLRCHAQRPRAGVVEAAIVVDIGRARARAVVIRLEEFRGRWRAERLIVL